MDRKSIIGIVIIAIIFIVWGQINKKSKEEIEAARRKQADTTQVAKTDTNVVQKEDTTNIAAVEKKNEKISEPSETTEVTDSVLLKRIRGKYGDFAQAATGEQEFYTIENDLLKLTLSTRGGRPYSVELKDYKTYDTLPLKLFDGDSTKFGLRFGVDGKTPFSTNDLYFIPQTSKKSIVVKDKPGTFTMRLGVSDSKYIDYIYTVNPGSYMVDMDIRLVGMSDIDTWNRSIIDLNWEIYSPQQEKGWKNESYYTTIYYRKLDEKVDYMNARSKKDDPVEITTGIEWLAFKDQFFSSVIISDKTFSNASFQSILQPENSGYVRQFKSELGIPFDRKPNEDISLKFFFGPNKYKLLKRKYGDMRLQDLVTVGRNIIKWINQGIIINIFDALDNYINNYGIIILLLTIIIKLFLFPLTYRSYLSQAKMRVLKPQIDEINKKYPAEKAMERQKATMALYKKVGVSPLGGCLPMVLQMPILFAMFRFFPTSIELRQQSFLWATDLSTYDAVIHWQGNIPLISKIFGNHLSLFTLLMTVSTIVTMRINSQATSGTSQMPGMKGMMYVMPVMFMFVLNNYSAGLTYYYFLANVITFIQNLIFKQVVNEEEVLKKLESKKAKPKKKSSFQARLEEVQRKQIKGKSGKRR
jgi:YidC/Oxa1 family membrane protein insertase